MSSLIVAISAFATGYAQAHAPATQPVASHEQLIRSINEDAMALFQVLPDDVPDWSDRPTRQKLAEQVVPIARRAVAKIDQLPPGCSGRDMAAMKTTWLPLLIVFEDQPTVERLRDDVKGEGERAMLARVSLALADRLLAGKDAVKAEAAATAILNLAREAPADDSAALALLQLQDDEFISAEAKAQAKAVLAASHSRVGATLRLTETMSTTRPAR